MPNPTPPSPSSEVPQLPSIDAKQKGESRGVTPETSSSSIAPDPAIQGANIPVSRAPLNERIQWPSKAKKTKRHSTWVGCFFCRLRGHAAQYCEKYTVDERWEVVRRRAWCHLCMTGGHSFAECRGRNRRARCRFCHAYHHHSLCHDAPPLPLNDHQEEANDARPEEPMEEGVNGEDKPKTGEPEQMDTDGSDTESGESKDRKPKTYGIYDVHIDLEGSDDDDQ